MSGKGINTSTNTSLAVDVELPALSQQQDVTPQLEVPQQLPGLPTFASQPAPVAEPVAPAASAASAAAPSMAPVAQTRVTPISVDDVTSMNGTTVAEAPKTVEEARADVNKVLGGFAAPQQGANREKMEPVRIGQDTRDAERIAREDTPLPNESVRTDYFSPNTIAAEKETGTLLKDSNIPMPRSVSKKQELVENAEESKEEITSTGERSMKKELSSSVMGSNSTVRQSIVDRESGYIPRKERRLSTSNAPNHRPINVLKSLRDKISKSLFNNNGVGNRIYGKMIPLPTLKFREIGVGLQEINAVIEQNPDMLDRLIRNSIPSERLATFTTTRTMLLGEVADLINSNNVEVFTAKPPSVQGQDVQRRKLRILESEQRGIYLHPIMAAMYTADFDGDDMEISLDPMTARNAKDPMEYMVGISGDHSLDMNLLPVFKFSGGYEEGKSDRDFVKEVVLARWAKWSDGRPEFDKLVDATLALGKTEMMGSDTQAAAYGDLFRAARAFADVIRNKEQPSNRLMADVIEAVYQSMKNLRVDVALHTIGEVVPRDSLPKAKTNSDNALFNLIDGMVLGAVPNNFQELKVKMNGFLGNVSGKSAPFRFTADVGKMMKLDKRLMVGADYVVDPDNVSDMTDFLECTMKFAYSKRMAVDVKAAGKSMYFTQVLRNKVVKEVGFPERYQTMYDFLDAFIDSYNRNAAIINEANLVWLTTMGLAKSTNRKTVHVINGTSSTRGIGGVTYRDLATPFIDVYGDYSFDRMLGSYKGIMEYHDYDERHRNSGNAIKVDWRRTQRGRRIILSKYKLMSIKAFSVKNHISLESDERNSLIKNRLGNARSDVDMLDGLIAAISDKRTSTSSKYNTDVLGSYNSEDGVRGHVRTTSSTGKKTGIGMMQELLTDIKIADLENTVLAPGYYAGIGSRETPAEVQEAMADVAKILADRGWRLRSGHADGADQAFERGAGRNADIYLPTRNFNKKVKINGKSYTFSDMSDEERALATDSIDRYHPAAEKLKKKYRMAQDDREKFGYRAHRRNYFQVVGTAGNPDSAFIACWTPIDEGFHGTEQALRIARDRGIPVFNAAEYESLDQWKADVIEAATKAHSNELRRNSTFDQMLHVDDAVMALNAINYEMFRDLGLDGTMNFLHSEMGRKLIEHQDDADIIAGIHAAMVFKWQTLGITRVANEIRDLADNPDATVAEYMSKKNRAIFEMDRLADKSDAWRGIIQEMRSTPEHSAFHNLSLPTGKRNIKFWKAPDFWTSGHEGYSSLRDVIEDLDMPWPLKCDIITDVVRWQIEDYHFNNFEVGFQLEIGDESGLYSLVGSAPQSPLKAYNDISEASTRYAATSARNLRNEVDNAVKIYRDKPGVLTNAIHRLATSPWELVHFDDGMYADVVLAVRDKVYAQTEKAQKHPATQTAYYAISSQRVGGFYNDVYRYDDRVLGLQSASQLSPMDLLKVLDDPNQMLTVYDEYGTIGYLNQQLLLGIDHPASEREIWDFLTENPRLFCTMRAGVACSIADTKGNGYMGARFSLAETLGRYGDGGHDTLGHVKYLMRDHPVYAGIISMLTPAHGTVSRNSRLRVQNIEDIVCTELYHAAAQDGEMAAGRVLQNLGITRLKLRSLLVSDFDKYMASMGFGWDKDTIDEAKTEADDIYDTIERHVEKYINEIRHEVPYDPSFMTVNSAVRKTYSGKIDSFRKSNFFLSNFYESNVTIDGITYRNAEAAFQAQKVLDEEEKLKFTKLTGRQAKDLGGQVELRYDWENVKEDIMRQVISAKFSNPRLRKRLEATGNKELIEGNNHGDQIWGVSGGVGRNLLGKILMEERGDLSPTPPNNPIDIDIESVASFWDAVQELSGAKVGMSTGIEGSETYNLSYWITHIGAKDNYADLESIEDLIYEYDDPLAFDGMWTNKGPLSVQIGEMGNVQTNIEELRAKKEHSGDEIVTMVPEGFVIPDKSTDSFGTPVPSLYQSMVSKRANGAEKFNLKAMKAGLDGTDSVTKMRDKYVMEQFPDGTSAPILFMQTKSDLEDIAMSQGINAARMELANRMMRQDRSMGYNDMSLANYMCLAEVMLIEGENGSIVLRSLEQIATGLRGRLGARVDEMTDEEVTKEIHDILSDVSEDGIGNSIVWDSRELLYELRPYKSAGNAGSSVKINSSVFARNYDLLSEISERANVYPIGELERNDIHESIVGDSGIPGIKNVWDEAELVRDYRVIGYAGAYDGSRDVSNQVIGPSNAIVIGSGPVDSEMVESICESAYDMGNTVIVSFENVSLIPDAYVADMIPINKFGDMMIPMFDIRLNGSEAKPTQPRFAIFKVPFERYVVSVEDPFNVFELGDAQYKFTRAMASRLKNRDSGSVSMNVMQLFPNVFNKKEYEESKFSVSLASSDIVRSLIDTDEPKCTIDYGLVEGASGFGQRVHDVNAAIRRYRNNLHLANESNSVLRGIDNLAPGDIVAWADMKIERDGMEPQHVLAPIIPFPLHGGKRVPETFKVVQAGPVNSDGSLISVDWAYEKSILDGGYAKYFDSSGGANKGMINLAGIIEDVLRLKNGVDVDAYCAAFSTDGRKIGTDKRIKTMMSLMAMARMEGYNFAKTDGAFPNDPDIRDQLIKGRLPLEFWTSRYNSSETNPIVFTNDKELNAFINYECKKILDDGGNPSDYLATSFEGEDGIERNECVMWEFECMFNNSLNYEDMLLKFMHTLNPKLCPNGIDDSSEDKLFRLYKDGGELGTGFDRGILQMQVPYPMSDGRVSYIWSNVFIGMSFFGEEYSNNSRPNVNGASDMLDAENTMAHYNKKLDKVKQSVRAAWSTVKYSRPERDGGALGSVR